MSTINTLPNAYYQLNSTGSGLDNTSTSAAPNGTNALLQAMAALDSGNNNNSSGSDAFLLDLSPQAQSILDSVNGTGNSAAASPSLFGTSGNFILSAQQQEQISTILAKYKDAPYSQDTFNQIQSDLGAAGLGPSVLSLQDQTQSFNPAMVLIDALNGTTDSSNLFGTSASNANEQTKSTNYIAGILKQWQNISTTYQASTNTATSTAGA